MYLLYLCYKEYITYLYCIEFCIGFVWWIYLEISFWFSASVIHLCSPFPWLFWSNLYDLKPLSFNMLLINSVHQMFLVLPQNGEEWHRAILWLLLGWMGLTWTGQCKLSLLWKCEILQIYFFFFSSDTTASKFCLNLWAVKNIHRVQLSHTRHVMGI